MRKGLGWLAALALGLMVLLTACTQAVEGPPQFDAGAYVTGVLKAAYLGEFDQDYLDMVGLTQAEAQTEYANGIHMEINNFYNAYGIETSSEELHEEIEQLFLDIYSHTSLTVTGVEEQEDGSFAVAVEVEPIDIVHQVHQALPELQKKFYAKYPESIRNTMNTEEYRAFDADWAGLILGLYQEKLETIGHLPVQTVTLRLEQDSQGYYGINRTDFLALDKLVIDYTIPEPQPEESPAPQESDRPGEGEEPQESGEPGESPLPEESAAPQEDAAPSESPAPQESADPDDPTPPTTGTPVPGGE